MDCLLFDFLNVLKPIHKQGEIDDELFLNFVIDFSNTYLFHQTTQIMLLFSEGERTICLFFLLKKIHSLFYILYVYYIRYYFFLSIYELTYVLYIFSFFLSLSLLFKWHQRRLQSPFPFSNASPSFFFLVVCSWLP